MAKYLELRRHTANDGDVLTGDGIRHAVAIGAGLAGGYRVVVSSGAQRATQTAACFVAGMGRSVPGGILVVPALRSVREDRWRAAYRKAGAGDLGALRTADPDLVVEDAAALSAGLRQILALLDDGERALAVGHSPTNEAAVFGLTGEVVAPMAKGGGVVIVADGADCAVESVLAPPTPPQR